MEMGCLVRGGTWAGLAYSHFLDVNSPNNYLQFSHMGSIRHYRDSVGESW